MAVARRAATPAAGDAPDQLDGPAVRVELQFFGVGKLHQTFFQDRQALGALGARLHGHVKDPARVRVAFDSEDHRGAIHLVVPEETFTGHVERRGDNISLDDLVPMTRAMALWRDEISSRYDLRVQSFHVHLSFPSGATWCTFSLTGTPPPDGRTISPCVEIKGEEVCGVPGEDGTRFTPPAADEIARCLDIGR